MSTGIKQTTGWPINLNKNATDSTNNMNFLASKSASFINDRINKTIHL